MTTSLLPSRCISISVIRTDDRTILSRFDVPDQTAPPVSIPTASTITFDWNILAQRIGAAAVNKTRIQMDLVTSNGTTTSTTGSSSSNSSGSGRGSAQIHGVVSRPKNITVACICTSSTLSKTAFVLCDTALGQFEKMFVERTSTLSEAQCQAFNQNLADAVNKFNVAMAQVADDDGGRIDKIKQTVESTKGVMLENIDRALDRGAKIDSIVEASAELSENAQGFSRASAELERSMWWKSMKMKIIVCLVLLAIILVIVMLVCGGKCFGKSGETSK